MEVDEAWAELGIGESADQDAVRRTYLRLLKTRKPESDPKGFARLREAWETLRAELGGARDEEVRSARAEPIGPDQPVSPAPLADPPIADDFEARPPAEVLAQFRDELRVLPVEANPEFAINIARRAVVALPQEPEPLVWLAQALLSEGESQEVLRVLRAAVERRAPDALELLALHFPSALSEDELASVLKEVPPQKLWAMAEAMRQANQLGRASKVVRAALDQVVPNFDHPPPKPSWFAVLILEVHAEGSPLEAKELFNRYDRWLRENDLVATFRLDGVAQFWPLIEELNALPPTLPPLLRRVLARSLLDSGGSDDLTAALQGFARYSPEQAEAAIPILLERPLLSRLGETLKGALVEVRGGKSSQRAKAVLAPALMPNAPARSARARPGAMALRLLWFLLVVAPLMMPSMCNNFDPDDQPGSAPPPSHSSP